VSDSQQDLIGEKYLAEQIKIIQEQQRTTSILDKWSHLLYEGEREYSSNDATMRPDQETSMSAEQMPSSVYITNIQDDDTQLQQNDIESQYSFILRQVESQVYTFKKFLSTFWGLK
jgi:hypothetical protein